MRTSPSILTRAFGAACAVAFAVLPVSASAHDFWLQPATFAQPTPGPAALSVQIGHADDRARWTVQPGRIVAFASVGSSGVRTDQRGAIAALPSDDDLVVPLATLDTHLVFLETNPIESVLPGPQFTAYAEAEGLTPALVARARASTSATPGREIYSRRAKALIAVGPATPGRDRHITTPLGLTLEIVPDINPYRRRPGQPLGVRVFYAGKPLPGATIKLTDLDRDDKPLQTLVTDRAGRARFTFPDQRGTVRGKWLLNTVWTKPITGDPRADFETVFSSLAFGGTAP